jgi:glycosyltransferase involved in cell wall biosynthesis
MKIVHLNYADINGGAFRAGYRIHHSLLSAGIESRLWVNRAYSGDWTVNTPESKFFKAKDLIKTNTTSAILKFIGIKSSTIHSPSIFSSDWVEKINSSDCDIVHLHWVQGEMISISDIGQIKKPIVWTLHDMWAFCGAEHYTNDYRWREGYTVANRPTGETGFDINRWTWQRKLKYWKKPMYIVGDSKWLARCASESILMKNWQVKSILYPLDLDVWKPIEKNLARSLLNLPNDVPLLAFGAMGGAIDPRKGFDLLADSIQILHSKQNCNGLQLLVFGERKPELAQNLGFPIHYFGHLYDDQSLRMLYSAADALVVPSRQEAFGQTASEAHACGTPVIAFDTGGLPDIIDHMFTGYLAKPFSIEDLSEGIAWVLENCDANKLGLNARARALNKFSPSIIANDYINLYKDILNHHPR